MLQKIEKKDGSIENYSRQKIENWVLWGGENIKGTVNFDEVIDKVVAKFSVQAKSSDLQKELISQLLQLGTTSGNLLAGRLYMADIANDVHDRVYPPLKHQVKRVHKLNLGRKFAYSDEELDEIEKAIDHQRNYAMSYDQISQVYTKYSLNNRVMKKIYETPQFVYARIALHVCEKDPIEQRIANVIETYDYLSLNKVNSPSPNYINIGTNHLGLASCCLYRTDDNLDSMEAGNHIAYKMTAMSAGIGGYMALRSIGDPIRGGSIVHAGKIPYMRDIGGRVTANLQAGRGGACNQFYIIFDPEAQVLAQAQNPRTPVSKQNRSIHFTAMINDFFLRKVNNKEKIFTFTEFSAPDLHKAFFYGESETFTKIYEEYEKDEGFKKNYVDAAELAAMIKQQSAEVATHYICNMTEINRHTPHKDTIFLSNLCVEITQPTFSYSHLIDLYEEEDHGRGEVSLCSLGAIVEPNIVDDADYERAAYISLKIIDFCIDNTEYALPHIGFTAKKRRNAGVGLIGVAHTLAKNGIRYSSDEGLAMHHAIAERHSYFLIKASLQLAKEHGCAEWIHKTKWPEGWLPIDTYKRSVDEVTPNTLRYEWEPLRAEMIAVGGIRHSSLVAHMPTESSSKATGYPNCFYPIRALVLKKSDMNNVIDWVAKDNDIFGDQYELAYKIPIKRMIDVYSVYQKFGDQSISADEWIDRSVNPYLSQKEMVDQLLYMGYRGVKSKYYSNSLTADQNFDQATDEGSNCVGGCTI